MELRNEEIDFIINDLKERGLKKKDILDEIVDHVCSDVEERMRIGESFEAAYRNVIEKFKKEEFKNLGSDIKRARELFIFVDEKLTPTNVNFNKSAEGIRLTAFATNKYFIIIFLLLLVGSFTMAVIASRNSIPLSIVFFAGSLYFFAVLALNIFGKTSIIISNYGFEVNEGLFPLTKHFSFPFAQIKNIYLETGKMKMELRGASTTASIDTIAIVGNTKRKFGKALSSEQRYYIINVLKKYFRKADD